MRTRRRKKQQLQLTLIIAGLLLLVSIALFIKLSSTLILGAKDITKDYYSIEIEPEDTIWNIAMNYYNDDYRTFEHYVEEIIEINGLSSETVYPGQVLTIPIVTIKSDKAGYR